MTMTITGGLLAARFGRDAETPAFEVASIKPAAPLLTSLQQLGLKPAPRKAPTDRIIVDSGERVPTVN
jgi:hypothetical protein